MIEAKIIISGDEKKKQFFMESSDLSEGGAEMCLMCLAEYCKKQFKTPTSHLIAAIQVGVDEETMKALANES